MNRRGFIGSILALGVAPAIVRADSLMRVVPRDLYVAEAPAVAVGNRLLTIDEITAIALRICHEKEVVLRGPVLHPPNLPPEFHGVRAADLGQLGEK